MLEEIPEAYKDIDAAVDIVHNAGLARKVGRLRPRGCQRLSSRTRSRLLRTVQLAAALIATLD